MIKKWVLKALVQKTISYLPNSHRLNYFFQKHVTKGVRLSEDYFEDRLIHASKHIQNFDGFAKNKLHTTLELGTGWYPVVPISLFLRGAQTIHTADISPLCNKENLLTTIEFFLAYHSEGKLKSYYQPLEDRLAVIRDIHRNSETLSLADILDQLNINYHIGDIRTVKLPKNSIDLIHSNNTFEHVYPEVLKGILEKFQSLSAKGGIMSHFIDMSDHFAHFDHSITIYNFLKYSDRNWNLIDNSIQPQNRWRLSEYKKLFEDLQLDISNIEFREGRVEEVKALQLAEKYRSFDIDDLAISHCYIVSRNPG